MNTRPLRLLLFLLYQGLHTNTSNLTDDSDVNLEEVGGYFQGDIVIPEDSFRSGYFHEQYLWPGGAVPYELNPFCTFTAKETTTWKKAVDLFTANTCIRFREKTAADKDYVSLQNKDRGCFSMLGRHGGRQPLNLQPECNEQIGTVLHEMMHVLGIVHEQSRVDRDEYVHIYWENIIPGRQEVSVPHRTPFQFFNVRNALRLQLTDALRQEGVFENYFQNHHGSQGQEIQYWTEKSV